MARLDGAEHLLVAGDHAVAAKYQIGAGRRHADGVDLLRRVGDADVAVDGAALLREAGHVDDAGALAFQMRRHADDGPDGDDSGAADAGDDDAVGVIGQRKLRIGQRRPVLRHGDALAFFELGAVHGDEGRAEAFDAGIILVATRLVDGALAAPFGRQRLHRDAIRFHAAIAAAFADEIVDHHALVGIGESAALAAAAFLGGAGLVIDEDAHAGHGGELALQRVEFVAVMHSQSARPIGALGVFPRRVGGNDHAAGAFGSDLARDLIDGEAAVIGLAAGHRHRVVEENFVGHLHPGGDRRADGHIAGVVVGAVAQILEYVVACGERRLADPVGALAAHLGVAERFPVHPLRHVMAADAGVGAAAFGHAGRGVVRAARAEIGNAQGDIDGLAKRALRRLQPRDIGRQFVVGTGAQQPLADADRDVIGIERALDREQPVALLVLLADAYRLIGGAVELLAHLHFDQRTLFLDHDDEIEAAREFRELLAIDRPDAADLEQAQAEVVAFHFV